jgi:hypothetical protein
MKTNIIKTTLLIALALPFTACKAESLTDSTVSTTSDTCAQNTDLITELSDDIGVMADRILEMADKIGEMADRIVHTEQLVADMVVDVTAIRNNTETNSSKNAEVLIITSLNGDTLTTQIAPQFSQTITSPDTLVYISSNIEIALTSTAILVHSSDDLQTKWEELQKIAKDGHIYIAVRAINGSTISAMSNVLEYSFSE